MSAAPCSAVWKSGVKEAAEIPSPTRIQFQRSSGEIAFERAIEDDSVVRALYRLWGCSLLCWGRKARSWVLAWAAPQAQRKIAARPSPHGNGKIIWEMETDWTSWFASDVRGRGWVKVINECPKPLKGTARTPSVLLGDQSIFRIGSLSYSFHQPRHTLVPFQKIACSVSLVHAMRKSNMSIYPRTQRGAGRNAPWQRRRGRYSVG